ncbi:MAG: ATP-dependent Clp protease proteolytic subunit, partial [Phycisphaerales bacterium]|nr:ATP-dependent Clp protease proteolytic subunit [Phycisphaerales bacterium]
MNHDANTRGWAARWVMAAAMALAAVVLGTASVAQPTPAAPPAPSTSPAPAVTVGVPASRAASKVVVITIHGEIDRWTARSVARRIRLAQDAGADAIVFDIDTPGGEALAMLAISREIKTSTVKNTVAWVNRTAYSAGTVIALACREIVVANGSVLGDALPIEINILSGFKPIPDAEREKFLGPIMADLVDSARRSGHDEVLVQGFVRRGVELWLVEHTGTGERLFVTEEQYVAAVGREPERGVPTVPSITGSPDTSKTGPVGPARSTGTATLPDGKGSATDFIPASPNITPQLKEEVDRALDIQGSSTTRPDLRSAGHAGMYKPVDYVASGAG